MSRLGLMDVTTIQYSGRTVQMPKKSRPAVWTMRWTRRARERPISPLWLRSQHSPGEEENHHQKNREEHERDGGAHTESLRPGDAHLVGQHRECHRGARWTAVGQDVHEVDAG